MPEGQNKQNKKKKHDDYEDNYITSNLLHSMKVYTYTKLEHPSKNLWLRHYYVTDDVMSMQNYNISIYNLDA